MNIIVSTEDLFDVSVILLQSTFETMLTRLSVISLTAYQITNEQWLLCCVSVFKQIVGASMFPSFLTYCCSRF